MALMTCLNGLASISTRIFATARGKSNCRRRGSGFFTREFQQQIHRFLGTQITARLRCLGLRRPPRIVQCGQSLILVAAHKYGNLTAVANHRQRLPARAIEILSKPILKVRRIHRFHSTTIGEVAELGNRSAMRAHAANPVTNLRIGMVDWYRRRRSGLISLRL